MNILGFTKLMRMIYSDRIPNLETIQDMGLLAVKIAQHYALRVDFLDEKVCRQLQKLYRSARPSQGVHYREILERSVDSSWFDAFQSIEEIPFAAASIGQVHRGVLKNGDRVVIKMIKEDFGTAFLKDIKSLKGALGITLFALPHLKKVFNPMAILDHIEQYTIQELNLQNEIHGAQELRAIRREYESHFPEIKNLHFPHFYEELSSKSVLVSKLIPGETYDESLSRNSLTYDELLQLFNLHGLFLFGKGRFHGDMHPGNVIGIDSNNLCFVDTGALSSCGERIRSGLLEFFIALSGDDIKGSAKALNRMASIPVSGEKYRRFETGFMELYRDFSGKSVSEVSLTKKMMDTIKLGVHSGMSFDDGMFPIIKSLMYLDGMVLRCNPDAVLLHDMKPFIGNLKRVLEEL